MSNASTLYKTASGLLMASVASGALVSSNRSAFAAGENITVSDAVTDMVTFSSGSHNNLTITSTGDISLDESAAVYIDSDSEGASGNTIVNRGAVDNEGRVALSIYSDGDISNNTITNEGSLGSYGEAIFFDSDSGNISSNDINNSGDIYSEDAEGVYLYTESGETVSNNTITNSGSIIACLTSAPLGQI